MSAYRYASRPEIPGAAYAGSIQGIDDDLGITEGVPLEALGLSDPYVELDSGSGKTLLDFLQCMGSALVVSDRVREVIEAVAPPGVALVPIEVRDSKGNETLATYHLVHVMDLPDALDPDASGARLSGDSITRVRALAVDESALDGRAVVRLKRFGRVTLFHEELVKKLEAAEVTGVTFKALADYDRHDAL